MRRREIVVLCASAVPARAGAEKYTPGFMHPSSESRVARALGPIGVIVIALASMIMLSMIGLGRMNVEGGPPEGVEIEHWLGPTTVIWTVLSQGWMALAYVLSAMGWGRLPAGWLARESVNRHWVQIGLGLALLLTISHGLGVVGVLSGDGLRPRIVAWSAIGIGILMLLDQLARKSLRPEHWPVTPWTSVLWGLPIGLMIVAASNPPGGLWNSEFGSFDVLSYHLQLPKEWSAGSGEHGARLWPNAHNVYSYLPSYMEAAYLHLGAMEPGDSIAIRRLLGPEAYWVVGCQYLHAMIGVIGALLIARCAWVISLLVGMNTKSAVHLSAAAGAIALAVPWMTVVSSLAYNDGAMVALGAAALLCALDTTLGPVRRSIACAILVGGATACKPTALLMFTPVIGVVMLMHTARRAWIVSALSGAIAGIAMLSPWMVRNWLASGNPVFPFAARVFGTGHWTSEQVARYSANHGPGAAVGWGGRVARLFIVRSGEHFGLSHPQWALIGFVGLGLGVVALFNRSTHKLAAAMFAGLVAMSIVWMSMTHMQSRFLLPMLAPLMMLVVLGLNAVTRVLTRVPSDTLRPSGAPAAAVTGVLAVAVSVFGALHFTTQAGGEPNALLVRGPSTLSGMALENSFSTMSEKEQVDAAARGLGPEGYINLILRAHEPPAMLTMKESRPPGVYMLGDSTPLYVLGALGDGRTTPNDVNDYRAPVIYHTTWDESPLGHAVREHPNDPVAWSKAIRARDVGYVLVNFDELSRLIDKSKYYDPDVSVEIVQRWLNDPASGFKLVRAWPRGRPGTGRALFRFVDATPSHPALK
jgi:hypothetical protein